MMRKNVFLSLVCLALVVLTFSCSKHLSNTGVVPSSISLNDPLAPENMRSETKIIDPTFIMNSEKLQMDKASPGVGTPTLVSPSNGATITPGSTVTFDWSNVSGAVKYEMVVSASPHFATYAIISADDSGSSSRCTISSIGSGAPLGTYYWMARATDNATAVSGSTTGWGSWSSIGSFVLEGICPPCNIVAPTLSSPSNGASVTQGSSVTFDWSDVSSAVKYEIVVSASPHFATYAVITADNNGTSSQFTANNIGSGAPLITYYWMARGACSATATPGGTSCWGPWSSVSSFTLTLIPPVGSSPAISSLTANPTSINTGATSTITCIASDADGDTLSYSWSATGGTISGSGSSVTYMAPSTAGTYTITVTVSDGKGGSATKSVTITVSSSGTTKPSPGAWTGDGISFTVNQDSTSVQSFKVTYSGHATGWYCSFDYVETVGPLGADLQIKNNSFYYSSGITVSGKFNTSTNATITVSWSWYDNYCKAYYSGSKTYTATFTQ